MAETNPYLTRRHIEKLMRNYLQGTVEVVEVESYTIDNSASILVTLTSQSSDQLIGHFGLNVQYNLDGKSFKKKMVLKIKPHGREISNMLEGLAQMSDPELGAVYSKFSDRTGFYNTHMRELEIYQHFQQPLQPEIYGLIEMQESASYQILMEDLSGADLLNSAMKPESWTDTHIRKALKSMAEWHAFGRNTKEKIKSEYWEDTSASDYLPALRPLWISLIEKASERYPELYTKALMSKLNSAMPHLETISQELAKMPQTMVHNDCNPRNSCFIDGNFVLYDWELACWHVPQYDLVEFLCFALEPARYAQREEYVAYYRKELSMLCSDWDNEALFSRGLSIAALQFGVHRLGMYMMAHAVAPYPFLPRVVESYGDWMKSIEI